MRVTFKVLDSLSATPRHAANPDPQGPARMPPASRGPPPLGDPDRSTGWLRWQIGRYEAYTDTLASRSGKPTCAVVILIRDSRALEIESSRPTTTNLIRCVGAVSRLGAAVGCARCGAVVGLGVCGASGVAPHPAPSGGKSPVAHTSCRPLTVRSGAGRQHPNHASVKTASSHLQPMSVFLPPLASVACMVGAAAAHSQPPAAATPAWSLCSPLAAVRPPK